MNMKQFPETILGILFMCALAWAFCEAVEVSTAKSADARAYQLSATALVSFTTDSSDTDWLMPGPTGNLMNYVPPTFAVARFGYDQVEITDPAPSYKIRLWLHGDTLFLWPGPRYIWTGAPKGFVQK